MRKQSNFEEVLAKLPNDTATKVMTGLLIIYALVINAFIIYVVHHFAHKLW